MRIWIQGESEMDQFLKKRCAERGMILSSVSDCDLAVLRFPYSEISSEIKDALPEGQKIVCGIMNEEVEQTAKEKNWMLYRPLQDEEYLLENAKLTAEGAVYFAMNKLSIAIRDANCLVIGYGRIGKELTRILRALGAEVTVAARRRESREEAGENSIPISGIRSVIHQADLILNTVPQHVLSESGLLSIKSTAFLLELASKPYGFDMDAARRLGVHAYLESGIPGRYCPLSAASALLRYIERSVRIE